MTRRFCGILIAVMTAAVPAVAQEDMVAALERRVADRLRVDDAEPACEAMAEVVRLRLTGVDTLRMENVDALVLQGFLLLSLEKYPAQTAATIGRATRLARAVEARGAWDGEGFGLTAELRTHSAFAHAIVGGVLAKDPQATQQDMHDARRLFGRAVALTRSLLSEDGDSAAVWMRWMAFGIGRTFGSRTQAWLGDIEGGLRALESMPDELRRAPHLDGALLGTTILHYVEMLQKRDDGTGALEFVRRALAVLTSFQDVPQWRASVPHMLVAVVYLTRLQQYPAVHDLCEFVLLVGRLEGHLDPEMRARGQACLGDVSFAVGDMAAARLRYAVAEKEMELGAVVDPELSFMITSFAGTAAYLEGQDTAALAMIEKGLAYSRSVGAENYTRLNLLDLRIRLLVRAGRMDEAHAQRREAMGLVEEMMRNPGPGDRADLRLRLAKMLMDEGRHADAVREARVAVDSLRSRGVLVSSIVDATQTLAQALLHPAAGRAAEAAEHLLRLAPWIDTQAREVLPRLSRAEQPAFINLRVYPHAQLLAQAALATGDVAPHYAFFGGWKGMLVHQLKRQAVTASLLTGDTAAMANWRRYGELRAMLATQLARAAADSSFNAFLETEQLTRQIEDLERRIDRYLPRNALADPWSVLGVDGLRQRLPPDAAFVDLHYVQRWVLGGDQAHYVAVVTTRRYPPVILDLGPAALADSALAEWTDWTIREGAADHRERELTRLAWLPLAEALPPGTAQVWVSPDGQLSRAPWAFLAQSYDATAYLRVAQVVSGRHLAALLSDSAAPSGRGMLLVGDVDFGAAADSGGAFEPLPGTKQELRDMADLARGHGLDVTPLSAGAATEAAVVGALPGARYVHLATHGVFSREPTGPTGGRSIAALDPGGPEPSMALRWLARRNPLVESGLVFAGANAGGGAGRLTAEELVGVDLSGTELVVLSACDTGRGQELTGQGVMGLQASFTAAGARTLLMSLWKVPDESTALLMERFYHALWQEGARPAEALHRAQQALREHPRFHAPVHWAGWMLIGQG